jgi:hypothetical protein
MAYCGVTQMTVAMYDRYMRARVQLRFGAIAYFALLPLSSDVRARMESNDKYAKYAIGAS